MKIIWLGFLLIINNLVGAQSYVLIKNAHIANVAKHSWRIGEDVLIYKGNIVDIGKDLQIPGNESAIVIEATGKYLVPGLVDAHIHFFQSGGLYTRPDGFNLSAVRPYADELIWVKQKSNEQMQRYLASGVTAVVDCGGPYWNFDVREASLDYWPSPNVKVAGPLISTYQPPNLDIVDPPIIKVNTPEEAIELVELQLKFKPDFIKVWYIVQKGETAEQHLPIIRAIAATCKKNNIRLAVHATELETARLAVMEGADILVHSVFDKPVDEDFIKLLKSKKIIYVPTLAVKEGYEESFGNKTKLTPMEHLWADPEVIKSLFEIVEMPDSLLNTRVRRMLADSLIHEPSTIALNNLKRLSDAGVIIATGTDAGNIGTPHGPAIARELELMSKAGLSNWQLIAYSTIHGARVMGEANYGAISKGFKADLLLLNADPSKDFKNLFLWDTMLLNGKVLLRDNILTESNESLIQRQVNAYNARDIEAFLDCFDQQCKVYDFETGSLIMEGQEAMRKRYGKMFNDLNMLHCKIEKRMALGNKIIDQELVTGLSAKPVQAIAIYEIKQGLITKVWFIRG